EMNKLGFSNRAQGRDTRLGILGARSLLYNVWQVQRYVLKKKKKAPDERPLELDEFLGKTSKRRYCAYIPMNEMKSPFT
ncbi:MAG: hypothetical protein ACTSYC_10315, partial [Promethearchaeota archaeon]